MSYSGLTRYKLKGSMVKIMDIHNSSIESGGYVKKAKNNNIMRALRGMQSRCARDDRTLSKKERGVKIAKTE